MARRPADHCEGDGRRRIRIANLPLTLTRNDHAEESWWSFAYVPIRDADGTVVGLQCSPVETTGEVQSTERLRRQERLFHEMLQQMPGFVAVLSSPKHVYHYVNTAYETLSGGRPCLGRTFREVFPELVGQGIFELLDQVYVTGERFEALAIRFAWRAIRRTASSTCCTSRSGPSAAT